MRLIDIIDDIFLGDFMKWFKLDLGSKEVLYFSSLGASNISKEGL